MSAQKKKPGGHPRAPALTVVLPTYNEADSLPKVIVGIQRVMKGAGRSGQTYEILVVDDDSPDGTAAVAKKCGARVLVRQQKRGLASAIWDGFAAARAGCVFVMDADGQHGLEHFRQMASLLLEDKADLVVASRYLPGGSYALARDRHFISAIAAAMARPVCQGISDPMSGFFGVRRSRLPARRWKRIGFKLLPEIVMRSPDLRLAEVPLRFKERVGGQSKMDWREILNYLHLMARLYLDKMTSA